MTAAACSCPLGSQENIKKNIKKKYNEIFPTIAALCVALSDGVEFDVELWQPGKANGEPYGSS
ncbi:hypothetical protein VU03_02510 [Desulfobulbus sp. N3]|nr:hypothetical protein [Desulfobulbus sp. N3]